MASPFRRAVTPSRTSPATPQIAGQPEVKEVSVGSAAVLPCLASGFPVPEISWSKVRGRDAGMEGEDEGWAGGGDEHPMGADSPPPLLAPQLEGELPAGARTEGNVLTLPAVRHEDAGVYACAAANRRGQETAYYVLKVRGEDRQMDRWMGGVWG